MSQPEYNLIGKIPVRNLWLLMLYAEMYQYQKGWGHFAVEEMPDDLPELIAEILSSVVEQRLRRNLSHGYRHQVRNLNRVRGRIDHLRTARHSLLSRGQIACRFNELSVDTPRNRYVRAALSFLSGKVLRNNRHLAHRCKQLAHTMFRMGVVGERSARSPTLSERFGRHDADDRLMILAAQLAFDQELPTEESGEGFHQIHTDWDDRWVRKLFEKAVAGFYAVTIGKQGWKVKGEEILQWPIDGQSEGANLITPKMRSDITLVNKELRQRIVIDTKFNSITAEGYRERKDSLRSRYLYQIYAYLRTQEEQGGELTKTATGMLLHPSVGEDVDEYIEVQGHKIKFVTVDLTSSTGDIRNRLLSLVNAD